MSTPGGEAPGEAAPGEVVRFDVNERLVHWSTAALLLVLIGTGTILYVPSLMLDVGHRAFVVNLHVVAGFGLVAPLLVGVAGPWRGRLVADVRRLDRWQQVDFDFFRRGRRRGGAGKFNGGQKLAAAVFGGGTAVMILTGVVMRWSPPFPNRWASGATLVHDTIYLVLFALVIGHVVVAFSRPVQLRSMMTGRVPESWARRHAPAWLDGGDLSGDGEGRRASPRSHRSAPRAAEADAGTSPASD